jgi:hypothetical protein
MKEGFMMSIASRYFSMLFVFCVLGAQVANAQTAPDTAAIRSIINQIKANTEKITSFYAEFTLKEDSIKADSTHVCNPRTESWAYGKPDTAVFSFLQAGTWIRHNSVLGSNGEQFPNYEYIFMLNILADTFPDSWINQDISFFTAVVDSEVNDSIFLSHMNSSVHFNYTVDKKRWVVTRIIAGGFNVYNAIYTWSKTAGGIYYPSAITITGQTDLCDGTYPFTNIKVNGAAVSSVLPRSGKGFAGRSNVVSIGMTQSLGEKVYITLPYSENIRGVSITDASGRLVQNLAFASAPVTDRAFLWDGKGVGSRQVRAGVYFVTITTDRSHVSAKLPLVK